MIKHIQSIVNKCETQNNILTHKARILAIKIIPVLSETNKNKAWSASTYHHITAFHISRCIVPNNNGNNSTKSATWRQLNGFCFPNKFCLKPRTELSDHEDRVKMKRERKLINNNMDSKSYGYLQPSVYGLYDAKESAVTSEVMSSFVWKVNLILNVCQSSQVCLGS